MARSTSVVPRCPHSPHQSCLVHCKQSEACIVKSSADELADVKEADMGEPDISSGAEEHTYSDDEGPTCSICLQPMLSRMFVHPCYHSFCFQCICQWAQCGRACPECRQTILFGVVPAKGNDGYEKYEFADVTEAWPQHFSRSDVRYRTRNRNMYRRTPRAANREPHRHFLLEQPRMVTGDAFRRHIYAHGLRAKTMPVTRDSKFKEITPELFKRNPDLIKKLVPWIRRDLKVLLRIDDVEMIIDVIIAILQREGLESQAAKSALEEYLSSHTEHFVHELVCFSKSPWMMEVYDTMAEYVAPDDTQNSETSLGNVARPALSERQVEHVHRACKSPCTLPAESSQTNGHMNVEQVSDTASYSAASGSQTGEDSEQDPSTSVGNKRMSFSDNDRQDLIDSESPTCKKRHKRKNPRRKLHLEKSVRDAQLHQMIQSTVSNSIPNGGHGGGPDEEHTSQLSSPNYA
ncbi:uncharacterized protein SPPG_00169 [Spizellomyces punctatus DAOM BR117]|uniref:RING-type E3 ubiquitin transferase n=1 Tax=Spizellomyces punctatus (strain DAOM BR117) TaxID=645134 RepID=A0A0L0HU56_SPIPD|nr:uncharacterized protein SPPG_00169 [Spizellomyces punctatus DAOM BR117]KND04440.1 hypothetical protein SPPG_00169 [Spizellomyces punctatus DAOM BR117]|eukprot:XP_016612479.1 hypothetical protein SPPG_00169 [Spizellomyces punctatus DAOM BR117]